MPPQASWFLINCSTEMALMAIPHSLLVAYLFYPSHLHKNRPASGLVEYRQIGPHSPSYFICVLVRQRRPTSRSLDLATVRPHHRP